MPATPTINDFGIGDLVYFGRANGEKTLGKVVKINGKKLKVEQLEARGSRPVGTPWGVPPSLCTKAPTGTKVPSAQVVTVTPVAPNSPLEDAVAFAVKATKLGLPVDCLGKWITLNRTTKLQIIGLKTSRPKNPVIVQGTQGGKYILDVATELAKLDAASKPAPTFPRPFGIGERVQFSTPYFAHGQKSGDNWTTGVVEGYSATGRVEILTSGGVLAPEASKVRKLVNKRPESEILRDIDGCYNGLSPENLCCDGEASRAHVRRRAAELNRCLKNLFVELGRRVDEEEAYRLAPKAC